VAAGGLSADDIGRFRERIELSFQVGSLRARVLENLDKDVDLVSVALADRIGRGPKDLQLRAFCWAAIGIMVAVLESWIEEGGTGDVFAMVDASLAALEDGFAALSPRAAESPRAAGDQVRG